MAAVRPHAEDVATIDFAVEGMTCGSCAARVQRVLAKADGVAGAEVNFATGRAHVTLERPVPAVELQARVDGHVGLEYLAEASPRSPTRHAAMTRTSARAGPGCAACCWSPPQRCSRWRPCWPARRSWRTGAGGWRCSRWRP